MRELTNSEIDHAKTPAIMLLGCLTAANFDQREFNTRAALKGNCFCEQVRPISLVFAVRSRQVRA